MPTITPLPPDQRIGDEVPAGVYEVEFVGTVDKEPFKDSRFAKPGKAPEPRLGWHFKILSGPQAGKVIEQGTGTYPSAKSKLIYLLSLMVPGLQAGRAVNTDTLVGRRYWLTWGVNPSSDTGGLHVAALMPPPAAGAAPPAPPYAGRQPAPPPPPPPSAPRAQADPAEAWVFWDSAHNTERSLTRGELAEMVKGDARALDEYVRRPDKADWVRVSTLGPF